MRTIGGAVGSQIAATLVSARLLSSGFPAERGYVVSFAVSVGFLGVCLLASLLVPSGRPSLRRAALVTR
jgi:hypothetical protein